MTILKWLSLIPKTKMAYSHPKRIQLHFCSAGIAFFSTVCRESATKITTTKKKKNTHTLCKIEAIWQHTLKKFTHFKKQISKCVIFKSRVS